MGTAIIMSTGSTTITLTRRVDKDRSTFIRGVGDHTGRLKVGSAIFGGYGKLSRRKRVASTCSITLVSERLAGRRGVFSCASV